MCNTLETQRRVVVERLIQKRFNYDVSFESLLAEAFDAGVMEAQAEEEIVEQRRANHAAFAAEQAHDLGLDEAPPVDDAQLDEAMREIESEREAIMSGCVEPPRGGWLCEIRARGMGDDS